MKEAVILKLCMLAAAECGATVLRNNRGMFLTLDGKRKTRAGLEADGSSDLIGWTSNGRFLAIEIKVPGKRPSPQQLNFLSAVNKAGGLGFWVDNAETVKKRLTDAAKLL